MPSVYKRKDIEPVMGYVKTQNYLEGVTRQCMEKGLKVVRDITTTERGNRQIESVSVCYASKSAG